VLFGFAMKRWEAMMKIANINIRIAFLVISLIFLPLLWGAGIQASEFSDSTFQPYNMTQNEADWRRLELSEGQTRSKIKHKLVNYLLGRTVDQYLDLGADDVAAKKSNARLKLSLRRHRIVLMYQYRLQ
jgi:hypothetical protein